MARIHTPLPGDLVVVTAQHFAPGSLREFWWRVLLSSRTEETFLSAASVRRGTDDNPKSFLAWLLRTGRVIRIEEI